MNKSLRILLAEDEYLCLIGLVTNLKQLGHEIIGEASDGEELLKMALEKKPDLIITDINMPLLDGIEAIKKINEQIFIPSIIISGYHDKELIERATKEGIFNYLIKPVDVWDLKVAIEVFISKFEEFQKMKGKLDDTEKSLESRKYIEKAKGIIMDRFHISEAEAMKRLQKISRDTNKKMLEVANEIIAANKLLS
ncbi:response regulator [Clostridium sp.]|uniref:ANTAR domain-containing response regulator n=1 Tax=Clostridium sp. TaxID=1506 RepID=UPI001A4B5468|nr:response regulator [Clostridium sp.]MBK5236243.1 response regulator [Clostridium sp.]